MLSGFLFTKFGRQFPLLVGFLVCCVSAGLAPYIASEIMPGVYCCLVLIQIGTTLTSSAPLINDFIKPQSIGTAVVVSGLVGMLGTVASIGVLFCYT